MKLEIPITDRQLVDMATVSQDVVLVRLVAVLQQLRAIQNPALRLLLETEERASEVLRHFHLLDYELCLSICHRFNEQKAHLAHCHQCGAFLECKSQGSYHAASPLRDH